MATNKSNENTNKQNGDALFDAFPEPQGWSQGWDSTALQESSRPRPPRMQTSPTVRS